MNKKSIIELGLKALKGIPETPATIIINTVNNIRLRRILNRKVPVALTFFITNRCNATCGHCFYWKELSGKNEDISLYNIKKLSKSLRSIEQVMLTGGEPFLHNELVEICEQFYKVGVQSITIPTNGILTDRIIDFTSDIIKNTKLDSLKINVSLDGTREIHDSVRNVAGCYDKVIETIIRIKELKKKSKNLKVSVITTISHQNLLNLEDFIKEVSRFNVPNKISITRGVNYNVFGVEQNNKIDFNPKYEESIVSYSDLVRIREVLRTNTNTTGFLNWNMFEQLKLDYSIDIIKDRKRRFKCLAGYLDGVIYPNGDVALCESTKPVGNLKDFDMDFQKLWWSDFANKMRDNTKNCCCIHGCNLLSSMQYDGNSLKRIIRNQRTSLKKGVVEDGYS